MRHALTHLPHERHDENRRVCLGVTLAIDDQEIDVYNVHFSLSSSARESNAREVLEFVNRASAARPALLAGDLNARPHEDAIKLLTTSGGAGGMAASFLDCWPRAHADDAGFTDPSWQPRERIDYVLSRNVAWPLVRVELVGGESQNGVYCSDHLGLLVEFAVD
jgi:endonuclease/exonuclease/phosphatase family metal-dependent hydrolase